MSKQMLSEYFGFMAVSGSQEENLWLARFAQEVESETTRGRVLNLTSFIDELLIKSLKNYFPNSAHADSLLTSLEGCLSTIIYRANIAYSLSLLRKREYEAIKIIAKVRNEFAHKWDGIDFESNEVSKLIKKLPSDYFEYFDGSNKARFQFVCSQIISELLERHKYARRIKERLPREYKDIFDLPLEERQKILRREQGRT